LMRWLTPSSSGAAVSPRGRTKGQGTVPALFAFMA
jgi:hypothetical protein